MMASLGANASQKLNIDENVRAYDDYECPENCFCFPSGMKFCFNNGPEEKANLLEQAILNKEQ